VRRAAARHSELRRAAATGLWRVHLLAGGVTPEGAAHVAGLVCASADLTGLPYALVPRPGTGPLPNMLTDPAVRQLQHAGSRNGFQLTMRAPAVAARITNAAEDPDTPQPQSPFYASTRLLATLAAPPRREVPGLRFALRPDFDITPENGLCDTVPLGLTLDRNGRPAGPMALPRQSLNRHAFVCGATGAGKSQTIRALLAAAAAEGIPWLVIEPAKAEYHLMAARLPDAEVIRIRLGELDVPPAGVNPLEPAPGPDGSTFPLQVHADLVRSLFLAAFQAEEPFPQVLAAALTRCYEQAGWDMVTGPSGVLYPGLADLQAAAMAVVADIGYGREVADNVRGFVSVRIGSLRHGTAGRFLDGGHRLDFGELLDRNVVLEIEDAGDDHDKAFLIGIVLIRLVEHLRLRARAEGPVAPRLRHLTVIEEAHRLLRQPSAGASASGRAVEMFADLLAEVRAYGEGLIVAEQIPAKLVPDVIKNTAVKIVHRLPALDDREAVGATMNLTGAQSDYLVTLTPGEAAVFTDGMDYPLLVRMPDGTAVETCSPAVTAAPDAIISVRSSSCDPSCGSEPCTLRQIRAAQNAADGAITLWAELAVLGALTGWTPPVPGPELTMRLLDLPERLLGCALSHAVDAAVGARAGMVRDPAGLAVRVTGELRDFAAAGHPYPAPGAEWLAQVCRWNPVVAGLATYVRATGADGPPHPETVSEYGREVPGETCGEQLAAARAWKTAAWRRFSDSQHRLLVFGARTPSAIELAVGGRAGEPGWRAQVVAALADAFADGSWFLSWLAARSARRGR
jgi:DNA helicase HerA-like ATPase